MPTARPSISASVGAVLETVITLDTTITDVMVTPTPTSAVVMGIPAATSDRKVSTRMRNDTSSPSSSGTLLGSESVL